MEPRYLGDGVYVSESYGPVILTTGHHDPDQADDVIFLDEEVLEGLLRWLEDRRRGEDLDV
jgi:hypothetical protein